MAVIAIAIDSLSHSHCYSPYIPVTAAAYYSIAVYSFCLLLGGWRFLFTLKHSELNINIFEKEIDLRPHLAVTDFVLNKRKIQITNLYAFTLIIIYVLIY